MRCIRLTDFLESEYIGKGIHTSAAIFLRDFDPHEAHLTHFLDRRMWEFPTLIELSRDRDNLILSKVMRGITYHFVFFTKRKQGKIGHDSSKSALFRDYTLYFPLIKSKCRSGLNHQKRRINEHITDN